MKIKIKFFASHRELVGSNEIELDIENYMKIGEIFRILKEKYPALKEVESTTIIVINHNIASMGDSVKKGDVLAMFPPVSGG